MYIYSIVFSSFAHIYSFIVHNTKLTKMVFVIDEKKMSIITLAESMGIGDIDKKVCDACDDLFDILIDTKHWLDESRRTAKLVIANE